MLARVAKGIAQYVLLGAGLDTFAHRNPYPQASRFRGGPSGDAAMEASICLRLERFPHPPNLTYAPVDFESQALGEQLRQAGFDSGAPTLFAWLGVVPYLTLEAFRSTIGFIASQPAGSGVVLDYGQPRSALPFLEKLAHDSLAARVQLAGEPFRLFFTPPEMAAELTAFLRLRISARRRSMRATLRGRADNLKMRGSAGRLLSAWV